MLIHGRHDLGCPLYTAWELARAWPDAELITVSDAGHTGSEAMGEQIGNALDTFARQCAELRRRRPIRSGSSRYSLLSAAQSVCD